MTARPSLIGVDWGSTRFRAYLLDEAGNLIDSVTSNRGIFSRKRRSYEEILFRNCERWLRWAPEMPVLMAGMIGSRNGWIETEYLSCPVSIRSLGASIVQVQDICSHHAYIVPGISYLASPRLPDVIRGEETQIFGVFDKPAANNLIACVPGTHSKWIQVKNNRITRFSTYMTGEMFAAMLRCGSISSILDDCTDDADNFMEGVGVSQRDGGLLNHLFSIRSRAVTSQNVYKQNRSYLSGLLIGAEIRSALDLYPVTSDIVVIGANSLVRDYSLAFSSLGISVSAYTSENAFIKGLWELAGVSEKVLSVMKIRHA